MSSPLRFIFFQGDWWRFELCRGRICEGVQNDQNPLLDGAWECHEVTPHFATPTTSSTTRVALVGSILDVLIPNNL